MDDIHATMLIPDLDIARVNQWFGELKQTLAKRNPKFLGQYPTAGGGDLFTVGDDSNGYFYLQVGEEIIYFVRYRRVKANGNVFGRQVLVARRKGHPFAVKVASHVFYKYLLPKFKALISDTQQTQHGKSFWEYALDEAFSKNLNVYCLDRRSTPTQLIQIEGQIELVKHAKVIWGNDEGHKRTHVVISIHPLVLKDKNSRKT